jgi:3',5'-cyclic AMP phosphodiesterase CpdA
VTFGNHDDELGMSRKELYDFIKDMPGNLTSTVEGLSGVTNFILPVKASDGSKDAAVLYVFDSNSYATLKGIKGYGWIKHDQVQWYIDESKKFTEANGGTPLTALSFFHIPLPEFHEAVQNEGSFLIGTRKEKACAPEINTGLFAAMKEAGDVLGVFVGHDHVNDYAVSWKGIMLCYGRFTGGKTVYHDMPGGNGARVIELTEGVRQFRSWIRLKDGQVINEFTYPSEWIK